MAYRKKEVGVPNRSKKELAVWTNYRLTLEEYNNLLAKGCFICGSAERLCIDHDHKCCSGLSPTTGKRTTRTCGKCIRGVLCRRHNLAEGHLNSDPEEVKMLLKYLTKDL